MPNSAAPARALALTHKQVSTLYLSVTQATDQLSTKTKINDRQILSPAQFLDNPSLESA